MGLESGLIMKEAHYAYVACPKSRRGSYRRKESRGGERKVGKRKMESAKKIAHEIGGVKRDALRFGLNGVKSDIVGSHPLESSYESVISLPRFRFHCFSWR